MAGELVATLRAGRNGTLIELVKYQNAKRTLESRIFNTLPSETVETLDVLSA